MPIVYTTTAKGKRSKGKDLSLIHASSHSRLGGNQGDAAGKLVHFDYTSSATSVTVALLNGDMMEFTRAEIQFLARQLALSDKHGQTLTSFQKQYHGLPADYNEPNQ